MRSVEHQYAETAYRHIQEISRFDSSEENRGPSGEEYGRLCHTFPSMVMLNGLRLTVAFFQAKAEKFSAHLPYLQHLSEALGIPDLSDTNNKLPMDSAEYRRLTQSALQASMWFKRYAVAILKVDHAQGDD